MFSESAIPLKNLTARSQPPARDSKNSSSHQDRPPITIRPLIKQDDSDSSSSNTVTYHHYKQQRFTKGIKVTLSYTLKVSFSLQE